MIACEKCLNNEYNSKTQINGDKICQQCKDHQVFSPLDDAYLNSLFEKTKAKNKKYDALVPLSGGKDSTYVLYLALKKYGLNVLTYTFDNAFKYALKENQELANIIK